jgi:hypothetical protein
VSTIPVVKRMVMFKHGVAYIVRAGPADGPFELSFKKDEMNDVLKSLTVWVARGEAKVGAVAFEKPEDPEEALEERKLALPPGQALAGLVSSFRGRRVLVKSGGVDLEGEIIGLESDSAGEKGDRKTVAIKTTDGTVALVDLAHAKSIDFLDASSRADLAFIVDRSRAAMAGTSRTVRVGIDGKAEDLRVSYVVPAPTWRVTYRIARDEGATMLMAWGIVHNPVDEDLDDLDLTLTTGQPVSFMIDLYNPRSVRRAVAEETSRAAAAPTQFERSPMKSPPSMGGVRAMAPPGAPAPRAARAPMMMAMAEETATRHPADYDDITGAHDVSRLAAHAASMGAAAEYVDRGELFEYRVANRVSLKRGGSAMVPLLGTKIEAKKERLWRLGAPPSPDLVLTFKNETGAVLEEGAAVVYDQAIYAGEAMVPYSARGTDVKLAFAKDLGVRCKHTSTTRTVTAGVRLKTDAAIEEQRGEEHREIVAESDHDEEIDVIFEIPKMSGRQIDPAHAQPFEDTMNYQRYLLKVPPKGRATAKIVERWHQSQRYQYRSLTRNYLEACLSAKFLDQATFDQLAAVLGAWERGRDLESLRGVAASEQQAAYTKQERISEQLGVLKDGGKEGELRLRYVRELEEEQNKVNRLEGEMRRLWEESQAAQREGDDRLVALVKSSQG